MVGVRTLEKVFDVQFVARNSLNRLNNQISQGQFASMITSLLLEKFVERREISAKSNGDLSRGIIRDETRVRLDH